MADARVCILGHVDDTEAFLGYACRRHYHWVGDTLREIETLFALRVEVVLPGSSSGIRSGTRVGSPAPGRIGLMEITDPRRPLPDDLDDEDDVPDVPGALWSYARRVQRNGRATEKLDRRHVTASLRVLRRERRWIVEQADFLPVFADGIATIHRSLARAVGDSMWPRSIGKCPNCGAKLYNTIGLDEVHCRRCKSTWTGVHLARLRLIHEQEARH